MIKWAPMHFVRLVFALAAGILTYVYLDYPAAAAYWPLLLAAGLYLLLYWRLGRSPSPVWKTVLGTAALLTTYCFGIALTHNRTGTSWPSHLAHLSEPVLAYTGTLDDYLIRKERSFKTQLVVDGVQTRTGWRPASGTVLLLLPADSAAADLAYGDRLLVKGSPEELKGPTNPGEFDYRRYLHFHNIFHRHFAKPGTYTRIGYAPRNPQIAVAFGIRSYLSRVFRQYLPERQERALASALVLGIKDELDNPIIRAYSSTGAMHVLAVSGLHVAIMYEVLDFFLKRLGQQRRSKVIRAGLSLALIWLYALVTGFSPSVLRAAVMFSCITVGKTFSRQHAIYNTMAFAGFLLLCYNPYMIMEVGFQLSFLAVLGIVYLFPLLNNLWDAPNRLLHWVWTISCVSVAAQIVTFPLGLLYFHQFPVYFLVSNLFVIPVASLVLYGGLVLLVLSPVPLLAAYFGKVLGALIWLMNKAIFLTEELPYSLIQGIDISILETWLLYGCLVLVLAFVQTRKLPYFSVALGLAALLCLLNIMEAVARQEQGRFTVYDIRRTAAVELLGARQGLFVADSSLLQNPFSMQFYIWRNWWAQDVPQPAQVSVQPLARFQPFTQIATRLPDQNLLLCMGGRKALLLWQKPKFKAGQPLQIDYLVLQHQVRVRLPELLAYVQPRVLILDSSNKPWYQEQIRQEAAALGLKLHNVPVQGAFVEEFSFERGR